MPSARRGSSARCAASARQGLILAASRTEDEDGDGVRAELDAFAAMGGRVVALGPGGGDVRSVAVDNIGGARALGAALTGLGYRDAIILGARRAYAPRTTASRASPTASSPATARCCTPCGAASRERPATPS